MGSDVYDAVLDLVNETEQKLKVVLLPNAYGWSERHEGVNSHGRQFIAAWNEVRRLWDPDLEGRLAGRRTDAVAFRNEVLAGCWLRVAKDVGLRVLAALQRLHDSQLGRPLVLKVRPTPRAEPEAPILAFSAEDIPAIVERFRLEPAFSWPEAPEKLAAAIRRDFAPLIVGIRQERAWAGVRASGPQVDPPPPECAMSRHGQRWRIRFGGQEALVDHRRGADHLRHLLAEPRVPMLATVLHGSTEGDLHANRPQVTRDDNAAELDLVKRQLQELLDVEAEVARDRDSGFSAELPENHQENKDALLVRAKELAEYGRARVLDGEVQVGRARGEKAAKSALVAVRQAVERFSRLAGTAGCARFTEHVLCSIEYDSATGTVTYTATNPPEWHFGK